MDTETNKIPHSSNGTGHGKRPSAGARSTGVPVGGFDLHSVRPRGLSPSFAELRQPDVLTDFVRDFWRDGVMPAVISNQNETPRAELTSPMQITDRVHTEVRNRLRKALSEKAIAVDGVAMLGKLRAQEPPFDDVGTLIDESFASLQKAIDCYRDDLNRHSIALIQNFSAQLRVNADAIAFERPVSMAKGTDRLDRLCRFVATPDQIPEPVRKKIMSGLRLQIFNEYVSITRIIIDDVLREKIAVYRRLCLDTADALEAHARHRVQRLEQIGNRLAQHAEQAKRLAAGQSDQQTVTVSEGSARGLWDRLGARLQATRHDEIALKFLRKYEAVVNQQCRDAKAIEDLLPIEELLRKVTPEKAVAIYEALLRQLLAGEQSIFDAIAADIDGYAEQLARKAMPTMDFAGRDSRQFDIASTLTAYLLIPNGETEFQQDVKKRFVASLRRFIKRIEPSDNVVNRVMLMVSKSPFVPGTQVGLLPGLEAYLELGPDHHPGLFGPEYANVPSYEDVRRYRYEGPSQTKEV